MLSTSSQRAQVGLFTVKMTRTHSNCTADIIHLQEAEFEVHLLIINGRLRKLKALIGTKHTVSHSVTHMADVEVRSNTTETAFYVAISIF